MKKIILLSLSLWQTISSIGQTPALGVPPGTSTNDRAGSAWYRGGNNPTFTTPTGANIFGTLWNSPIYTQTNGVTRSRINGSVVIPNLNGYLNIDATGHMGISPNNWLNTNSPYSLLHLNGREPFVQQSGFRPWMKTGLTLTDNKDLSYFGLRLLGIGTDVTETNIAWSDNGAGSSGPDELAFRFIGD